MSCSSDPDDRGGAPWRFAALCFQACLIFGCGQFAGGGAVRPEPEIRLVAPETGDETWEIQVAGLDQAALTRHRLRSQAADPFQEVCTVRVQGAPGSESSLPAMLGSWQLEDGVLRFIPLFPLEPGVQYRVSIHTGPWLDPAQGTNPPLRIITVPSPNLVPEACVTRVYPTADVLPENQLKFYIHFSAPMREGHAYENLELLDLKGRRVSDPFLELGQELWDPQGTRFTLLFDPGRVKRGLKSREEVGPPLRQGRRYRLVVRRSWPDRRGVPMIADFAKDFLVGPPDHTCPDPASWKIRPPRTGTREPLTLELSEYLDHALLRSQVFVRDPQGGEIPGRTSAPDAERLWSFVPAAPWRSGKHSIVIGTNLEDLAGNSVARLFEVDSFGSVLKRIESETVTLTFKPRGR